MNYQPVIAGNQSNPSEGVQETFDAEKAGEESVQQYVLFLVWSSSSIHPQNTDGDAAFKVKEPEFERRKPYINEDNAIVSPVPAVGQISTNNTNTFSELEDITYSDDEYDVGAEADFNNLETSITKYDKVAKDQGGLSQINNDDFHTCMFACFLSQEEPKRVDQALKDPSWIEAIQDELL
nr:putative ribonuclease H-like domain-containing protein [Tanacetum cinerariifolium]